MFQGPDNRSMEGHVARCGAEQEKVVVGAGDDRGLEDDWSRQIYVTLAQAILGGQKHDPAATRLVIAVGLGMEMPGLIGVGVVGGFGAEVDVGVSRMPLRKVVVGQRPDGGQQERHNGSDDRHLEDGSGERASERRRVHWRNIMRPAVVSRAARTKPSG